MILEKIKTDRVTAMKEKNSKKSALLSTLYAEAIAIGKNNGNRESTEEEVIAVIKKFRNNIEENIKMFQIGEHDVKIAEAKSELELYTSYLPKQLSKEELSDIVKNIITDKKILDNKGMGMIMKELKEKYAGLYDGKMASEIVKLFIG